MSESNIDLIRKMLDRDVEKRLDVEGVMGHAWCKEGGDGEEAEGGDGWVGVGLLGFVGLWRWLRGRDGEGDGEDRGIIIMIHDRWLVYLVAYVVADHDTASTFSNRGAALTYSPRFYGKAHQYVTAFIFRFPLPLVLFIFGMKARAGIFMMHV